MQPPPSRVIGLFPTPLMHARSVLGADLVASLRESFVRRASELNSKSPQLSHTAIVTPESDAQLGEAVERVLPHVVDFGELLFGERLRWSVKEMWCNVLEQGGHQAMHSHANSFVSGVVYLNSCSGAASTTFIRGLGQPGFVFQNTHQGSAIGPFNADKWVMPGVSPGDLVLFPSWLLHEVPRNPGGQRVTLAFNAIPQRLDSWGYRIGLSA